MAAGAMALLDALIAYRGRLEGQNMASEEAYTPIRDRAAICDCHGAAAPQGTHADRARFTVEAMAAFKKPGRVGRILSSRASILS